MSGSRPAGFPRSLTALLLPGGGSDEVFVRTVFTEPLRAVGASVRTPPFRPGSGVVDGYLEELDAAARKGAPLLVGGVSLGAQVAARWAAARCRSSAGDIPVGLLLALPAWTGCPDGAPGAVAAALGAAAVRRDGLDAVVETTRYGTPDWLGNELSRAWRRHDGFLADSLSVTARTPGPTEAELAALRVPVGLVGLRDDPVHPWSVAARWHELLPCSALVGTTLGAFGRDRATVGRAAVLAWLRARAAGAAGADGGAGP
ncbi:MAG TPA: alpha/beta hydrolase [Pseudonocardia sp.]|jgi:pimeloyl-ACP methyl ester carboxylesterase